MKREYQLQMIATHLNNNLDNFESLLVFEIVIYSQELRAQDGLEITNIVIDNEKECLVIYFSENFFIEINISKLYEYRDNLVTQVEQW